MLGKLLYLKKKLSNGLFARGLNSPGFTGVDLAPCCCTHGNSVFDVWESIIHTHPPTPFVYCLLMLCRQALEIPIYSESLDEAAESSPEEAPSKPTGSDDCSTLVKVRAGPQKKPPGFQACLACLTPSVNGESPGQITALTINSSYGL